MLRLIADGGLVEAQLLVAAEGLTAKRRAAPRIELPCSTAHMIRKRRSKEIGAGMMTSRLSQPTLSNHECRFHAIGKCSRGVPLLSVRLICERTP